MRFYRFYLLVFVVLLGLVSCGKRGNIYPPPPEGVSILKGNNKSSLTIGKGSCIVGDDGIAVLYWQFPFKYDYAEVYLNGEKIATVKGFSYIYPHPLESGKKYLFKVLVYKNGKPKGVANIKVSY
jgi:predicted small lipoprotein YifL